ncbi:hypothetical protein CHLNCDRAFT_141243 [Chlorella variabilis]|uniref:Uncharacterized protein n=1 Tax=Chlorella variabilis TaxID=554065 RepID=E1ZSF0_CHLVA|nr:hypothetical protein CHLNCDRAFT_141243 [Chlorella variabilis]EFN51232.1 hypothetical protein CHLNCDRAFT_141243 [Chlorella variabilis]|eukprot:XP_005843334.1 hypothetical protein CHLNCDRAFT_141243 [Chlorella variabilis]
MGGGGAADEPTQLQVQLERLRQQLAEEQLLRRQAEEAVEVVAADRSRLQKARDELATALLACERRAAEAEEEQLRAEAQAAALEAALREQQQAAEASAAAAAAAGPLSPATAERLGSSAGVAAAASRSLRHTQSSKSDSGLAADLDILLAELDQERQRSEELVRTLEAAEREAVSATEKLLKAQQRIKQLGSGGKGRGLFGGMKKSASSASLPPGGAGGAAGAAAGGEAEAEETAAVLQQRIVALKASRDKLIGAFDAQAAEIERLSGDNAALAESVAQLRDVAAKWEAQAQDSLSQNERLKDLLEESATWNLAPAAPCGTGGAAGGGANGRAAGAAGKGAGAGSGDAGRGEDALAAVAAGGQGDPAHLAALCQRFQEELLLEKARSAQLDMQVRALCMELTRAAQSSSQMQAALMPMLGGIEARLVQVLGMRPRPAAMQAASS